MRRSDKAFGDMRTSVIAGELVRHGTKWRGDGPGVWARGDGPLGGPLGRGFLGRPLPPFCQHRPRFLDHLTLPRTSLDPYPPRLVA